MPASAQRKETPDAVAALPASGSSRHDLAAPIRRLADLPAIDGDDIHPFALAVAADRHGVRVYSADDTLLHPVLYSPEIGYVVVVLVAGTAIYADDDRLWYDSRDQRYDAAAIVSDARQLLQANLRPDASTRAVVWFVDSAGSESGPVSHGFGVDNADFIVEAAISAGTPCQLAHDVHDIRFSLIDPDVSRAIVRNGRRDNDTGDADNGFDPLAEDSADDVTSPDAKSTPQDALPSPASKLPVTRDDWDQLRRDFSFISDVEFEMLDEQVASEVAAAIAAIAPHSSAGGLCLSTSIPSLRGSSALAVALAAQMKASGSSVRPEVQAGLRRLQPDALVELFDGRPLTSPPWYSDVSNWLYLSACRGHGNSMAALSKALSSAVESAPSKTGAQAQSLAELWISIARDPRTDSSQRIVSVDADTAISLFDLAAFAQQRSTQADRATGRPVTRTPVRPAYDGPTLAVLTEIGDPESTEGKSARRRFGELLSPLPLKGRCDPDQIFEALQDEFPWMRSANRVVAEAAAIARHADRGFLRLPPMLIVGSPGCGKSRWARRVAEISELAFSNAALGGAISSVLVNGIERGWSSGRPGHAVIAMQTTLTANPLVLVDECDKAGSDRNNGHPLDALLTLLEGETARRHFDPYLLSFVDLSQISWILTANSLQNLPVELVSRLEVIHVDRPTAKHFPLILPSVLRDVCRDLGLPEDRAPDIAEASETLERSFSLEPDIRKLKSSVRSSLVGKIWTPKGLHLVEA